ncbi:hypothetical protein GM415_00745 [Pseudodesulfovibrio cashew]|uniref:Uncharacterized protein n=1 Tax=Pseudodesulfovibrio cashew TaxID=2678688 RepID=A0A6I6J7E0_9BACT|nr:hypothetical protein [Pseudodesulfovibrio cashew]QGY38726.1 hypothetical protein GM415_00745 [Pseudodesulfovibrio cashew]
MNDAAWRIRRIVTLLLDRGYLAPDHAMAVASKLLEVEPLTDGFALLGAALTRQAATLAPFDREKLRLAKEVDSRIPHPFFSGWVEVALRLTDKEPIPARLTMPDRQRASAGAFLEYMHNQPSNLHRFHALLHLRQAGESEAFEQGVQIITSSHSGLLAGPIMAWGAYLAGKPLLAEMLLDEGVICFLTHNLRAQMAFEKGERGEAAAQLHTSLELEPLQPVLIEMLAAIKGGAQRSHELEMAHNRIGQKAALSDLAEMESTGVETQALRFSQTLDAVLPTLPAGPRDFWERAKSVLA